MPGIGIDWVSAAIIVAAYLFSLVRQVPPRVRYFVVAFLYLCMGGTVVKIFLRHLFAVKYIWVWPNVLNI